jgi:hypothetical protein
MTEDVFPLVAEASGRSYGSRIPAPLLRHPTLKYCYGYH